MFEFARVISVERQHEAKEFRLAANYVRNRRLREAAAKAQDRAHPSVAR
jgi:hypothetical protein